jgi:hypothetical protein
MKRIVSFPNPAIAIELTRRVVVATTVAAASVLMRASPPTTGISTISTP